MQIYANVSIKTMDLCIFYVGDGDNKKDMEPMDRSMEVCTSFFKCFYKDNKIDINNILIFDKKMSFETSLERIPGAEFKSQKKGTNIHLFNNFAESVSWFYNDRKLNWDKIIDDLNKIKTSHVKIFTEVCKKINKTESV
ncbi:hypothetical protein [Candidatus Mycoplasma mahonii]|uniref:hypothetical protein n=1 Tax=Candidatus Mycoplasma mahonii TaxID=3004105 RepID=UPI0026F3723C|nr:hypothetical protein [Candidatus Mycoplasma mahonii]WKX02263.1 hypothetical protein O3I44_02565 [Candidatus Mycoplasma mahonii]